MDLIDLFNKEYNDKFKKIFKENPEQAIIRYRGRPKKLISINSVA